VKEIGKLAQSENPWCIAFRASAVVTTIRGRARRSRSTSLFTGRPRPPDKRAQRHRVNPAHRHYGFDGAARSIHDVSAVRPEKVESWIGRSQCGGFGAERSAKSRRVAENRLPARAEPEGGSTGSRVIRVSSANRAADGRSDLVGRAARAGEAAKADGNHQTRRQRSLLNPIDPLPRRTVAARQCPRPPARIWSSTKREGLLLLPVGGTEHAMTTSVRCRK